MVHFLVLLAFTSLDQTFRLFTKDRFAMPSSETGFVLMFIGVASAFVQGGILRPLAKHYAEPALIQSGTLLQALGFVLLAFSPHMGRPALLLAGAILALGNGLTQPSLPSWISKQAPPHALGETLGTQQAIASLARMFGPALSGYLYSTWSAQAPYFSAALWLLLAMRYVGKLAANKIQ